MFKRKPRWELINGFLLIKGGMTAQESDALKQFINSKAQSEQQIKNKHIIDALKNYECTCETSDKCICECVNNAIKLIEDNNTWLKNG